MLELSVHIEHRSPTPDEYQSLRKTTSWRSVNDEDVASALARDLFGVCALHEGKVIGIGRVIGDGAIYFYIQDVIVLPEFQGQGVGTLLLKHIDQYLKENAPSGSFVGLMAADQTVAFYERFGFERRAEGAPGMFKIV